MTLSNHTKWALGIAVLLWASAFVGIRAGLQEYSPEGLALLRYLIASLCMGIAYYRLPRRNSIRFKDIVILLMIGVVGIGIYNIALNYGELTIASGVASFIISQAPIVTALFALFFIGESINLQRLLGFLVSVAGVVLIAFGQTDGFIWDIGIIYILIATVTGSLYSVLQKPFLKQYHAIEVTTYVIWGGTFFMLIYTPSMQYDMQHASWQTTAVVVYLGIFPAALGYLAWSYALSGIPASRAVSFLYFMPFITTLLGWLCLNEVPTLVSVLGGILAIMGVWLVNQSYFVKLQKQVT